MARKRTRKQTAARESLHVTLPPDAVRRVKAYAGWYGLDVSEVVLKGVLSVTRGFSVRQDAAGPKLVLADGDGDGGEATVEAENAA